MELRESLLHSPLDFKHQMIELGSSSISLPSSHLIYGIIIVRELGVLIEYASRAVDPRPNKKTRWFYVPCPDRILKERMLEKGNECLIGKWPLPFTEES